MKKLLNLWCHIRHFPFGHPWPGIWVESYANSGRFHWIWMDGPKPCPECGAYRKDDGRS